ncbi:hypothetical protein AGLY_002636 [Aphis glycines]|uniref:Uncharacterized protein n=1 Tax=Aphis glycines TaxID=307491 RepID=A0A6G0U0V4_APHGL|nr:hypothetical protein AGLY_002636 [Aphis glycines]
MEWNTQILRYYLKTRLVHKSIKVKQFKLDKHILLVTDVVKTDKTNKPPNLIIPTSHSLQGRQSLLLYVPIQDTYLSTRFRCTVLYFCHELTIYVYYYRQKIFIIMSTQTQTNVVYNKYLQAMIAMLVYFFLAIPYKKKKKHTHTHLFINTITNITYNNTPKHTFLEKSTSKYKVCLHQTQNIYQYILMKMICILNNNGSVIYSKLIVRSLLYEIR